MDDLTRNLEELGRATATELERRDVDLPAGARERVLAADVGARSRRSVGVVACLAAAAVLAGALLVWRPGPAPITFTTGAAHRTGIVGEWIAAPAEEHVDVAFSEGTRIVLAPGARARVTSAAAHGAALTLEEGRLDATVTHAGADTTWSLRAGPFDVRITGTQFVADWNPSSVVFELEMQEGTVVVSGPELDGGRRLAAGERLRVSVREHALEVRPARADADHDHDREPAAEASATPTAAREAEPAPSTSTSASAAPIAAATPDDGASYAALVSSGHADQALARADRAGFAAVIARAPLSDVTALADAARFGGRPAEARDALIAARRRFGARGATAFLLGKITAEHRGLGDPSVWLETYVREEPNGALVEQALGRLMELERRDPAAANAVARRYLDRFPHGAYAPLARSLRTP
jgi:FecR protein